MLLVVAATGILQHVLHRAGLERRPTSPTSSHLMGVVPMLVLEVPFSKWSHLAYRPLAMYFADVHARRARAPSAASVAARAASTGAQAA